MTNKGNTPVALTYGMSEVQLCNVKDNIQYRLCHGMVQVTNNRQAERVAVVDALFEEGKWDVMPKPTPAQMRDLIAFAKQELFPTVTA